jgi:hypothetical protein
VRSGRGIGRLYEFDFAARVIPNGVRNLFPFT